MNSDKLKAVVLSCVALATAGCTGYGNAPDKPQGYAVEQMRQQQTAYPAAGAINGDRMADLDGPKGEKVLDTYRADVAQPQAVQAPIQVNIGN